MGGSNSTPTTDTDTPTMRVLLALLALSLASSLAQEDSTDNCIDISRYGEMEFNETIAELCSYKFQTTCIKRSQEVCQDVPVHECEVIGFPDCEDQEIIEPVRDDTLDIGEYHPIDCQPSPQPHILTEVKMMAVCQNITKQQCDTKWVINELGEKVWAGNENCQDVTWEDCSLQPRNVTTEVDTYDCKETEKAIETLHGSQTMPVSY